MTIGYKINKGDLTSPTPGYAGADMIGNIGDTIAGGGFEEGVGPTSSVGDALGGAGGMAFLANPVVGAGLTLASLVFKGVGAWQASKRRKEAEAKREAWAKQTRADQLAENERSYQLSKEKFGLSRKEYAERVKQNRIAEKERGAARKFNRNQGFVNNLKNMVNQDAAAKNKFMSFMGPSSGRRYG